MTREEAIKEAYGIPVNKKQHEALQILIPELRKNEEDRIIQFFAELATDACGGPGQEYYEELGLNYDKVMAWLEKQKEQKSLFISAASEWMRKHICNYMNSEYNEFHKCVEYDGSIDKERLINDFEEAMQKEQKPIEVEVYEIGKGTAICGQDYKCKKDYKEGNCRYIKDAIYHCGRDGYLTDQNGVSWSCTPEWFNEYIQSNTEWAEEEKTRFVSGQFIQCKLSFDGFKEGEHYWLEYVGDDMYVGRSDNILNQKFHITPRQLYTLFSQQLDEAQEPPKKEEQVSLDYEPPFDENPSNKEIIEALIKHLKEQDGFLTAINCVSIKAILSWLEKQKEQKPELYYDKELDRAAREFYFSGGADSPVDSTGLVPIVRMAEFGATWMKERMEKEQKPADNVKEYVKKFKALCDAYEIKLPNREYDIYHLCGDLAELFGNTNKQE